MGLLDYDLSPQQLGLLGAAAAAGNAYAPQPASRLPLAKPNLAYTLSQMAGGLGQGYGAGLQDQLAKQQAYAEQLANLQNTGMYNITAQTLGWPTMPMPQGTGLPGMPGMPSGAPAATGAGLATANAPPIQVASAQGAAPPVGVSPPSTGGGAPFNDANPAGLSTQYPSVGKATPYTSPIANDMDPRGLPAVYSPPRLGGGGPPGMDPDMMRRMILAKNGLMPPLSPTQINLYNAGHDPFDRSDSVTREALDAEARKGTPSLAGDVKFKETLAANEQEQGPNGVQPMPGSIQSASRKASAVAGATKAAETANSPASLVTLIGPNGDAVSLDQNRQAAQIDKLVGSGGYRVYNQQTPTETTDLDVDKGVRKDAIAQQTAIGRQRQTLGIARSVINDPSFKSGKWQELSAPARAFLSDVVPNLVDSPTVTTQQAYESALARLTFQEAPTLNVKGSVRGNMLPLMSQVQGEIGNKPEANRAALLIGSKMADWDLKRIDVINRAPAPRAAQAESQYMQANPVDTPEFVAGLNTTMSPNKLVVPKLAGEHEFYEWYQNYKEYWTPQQRAAAQQVMRNFDMGKNTTGQTFSVGAPK